MVALVSCLQCLAPCSEKAWAWGLLLGAKLGACVVDGLAARRKDQDASSSGGAGAGTSLLWRHSLIVAASCFVRNGSGAAIDLGVSVGGIDDADGRESTL